MPQRNIGTGPMASERLLIELWDLLDALRLAQSEKAAEHAARAALEAARTSTNPNDPIVQAIKDPKWDLR